jgi:acyl-[acyl-carrier-protein]-phospholipid O-acyltransferase/long-chain-fatty-acid--[acyl-carrier-protein] ligase
MERASSFPQYRASGLPALTAVQFLGSLNDHLFKMVVSLIAVVAALGEGMSSSYLSLTGIVFLAPYLLFSGYAGWLADALPKGHTLVGLKVCEVAVMGFAALALIFGQLDLLFVALFLMASQSALLGPVKYGLLPELLPRARLSAANGLIEMSRCVAVILGTAIGGVVMEFWHMTPQRIGALFLSIAGLGVIAALAVRPPRRPTVSRRFDPNPWRQIGWGIARIRRDPLLAPAVAMLTYFEFLGALLMLDMILVGKEVAGWTDGEIGLLGGCAGLGVALGSFAVGRLSAHKIELGIVPFAVLLAAAGTLGLYVSLPSLLGAAVAIALVGLAGGGIFVPLNARVQNRPAESEKGRVLATNNFLNMVGVLVSSVMLWVLRDLVGLGADTIVLVAGATAGLAVVLMLAWVPEFRLRSLLWAVSVLPLPARFVGWERLPSQGPGVLHCRTSHILDGFVACASLDRPLFVVIVTSSGLRRLAKGLFVWLGVQVVDPADLGCLRRFERRLAAAQRLDRIGCLLVAADDCQAAKSTTALCHRMGARGIPITQVTVRRTGRPGGPSQGTAWVRARVEIGELEIRAIPADQRAARDRIRAAPGSGP